MKRKLLLLLWLGFWLTPAALAQNLAAQQVQTLQSAATATGNGTALDVRTASAISAQITGTFVGTVTWEGTVDGTNWIALQATNANDDSRATTATAPGIYSIVLHGCVQFRARISAYTSGSITVKGRLGQGMITRNAGGGGTSVGGSNKQVQVNAGGSLAGAAGFEYQSGVSPNIAITQQGDALEALQIIQRETSTVPSLRVGVPGKIDLTFDSSQNTEPEYSPLQLYSRDAAYLPVIVTTSSIAGHSPLVGASNSDGASVNLQMSGSGVLNDNPLRTASAGTVYTTGAGGLNLVSISSNGNAAMRFTTGANSFANERMRITNTGNVGIGTTTPGAQLHAIAKADDKAAFKIQPFSDSFTAAPFEISGNSSGVTFLFEPLYGDSRGLAHFTMLGDTTMPSPTIAIKSSDGAGSETENPTISVFNSSTHGPIMAAIGPGFSGGNFLELSDSSYLFSAGATGGLSIMATGSGAPIRFATGGFQLSNERFKIGSDGAMIYPATNTTAGTTGAQTINKVSGTVNFAAGASSLVVTNSLVTANSLVFCTVRTNDSTAVIKNVVPTSGSFTIRLSATATAETSVGFFVINQ